VEFLGRFTSFLLTKAENVVLVIGCVGHWHISETGGKTFKDLLLSFLSEEKLHVAANGLVSSLVDTNEVAPFGRGINSVIHDLACSKFSLLFKDSNRSISIVDVCVVNIGLTYNTKFILTDPSPESNWLINLTLLELGLGVKVEYLKVAE
jgi:hypothetical protein